MYTELYLSVEIKDDPEVVEILKYMASDEKYSYGGDLDMAGPRELPDHEFFLCDRWTQVLTGFSYYFTPKAQCDLWFDEITKSWFLVTRFDLKNYDNEIEKFVDWLTPYIETRAGLSIGHKRYEEADVPTILYHPNTWICSNPPKDEEGWNMDTAFE